MSSGHSHSGARPEQSAHRPHMPLQVPSSRPRDQAGPGGHCPRPGSRAADVSGSRQRPAVHDAGDGSDDSAFASVAASCRGLTSARPGQASAFAGKTPRPQEHISKCVVNCGVVGPRYQVFPMGPRNHPGANLFVRAILGLFTQTPEPPLGSQGSRGFAPIGGNQMTPPCALSLRMSASSLGFGAPLLNCSAPHCMHAGVEPAGGHGLGCLQQHRRGVHADADRSEPRAVAAAWTWFAVRQAVILWYVWCNPPRMGTATSFVAPLISGGLSVGVGVSPSNP